MQRLIRVFTFGTSYTVKLAVTQITRVVRIQVCLLGACASNDVNALFHLD